GGGPKGAERQHKHGRLTARERIDRLVDGGGFFQELGLWAAYEMYKEHGGAPGAGVVTGVGPVHGRPHMIIANDATVKAGAFFPMTCKKIIRAQEIAIRGRLPLIYLVDSAGVFLPLQEDVFPDTDDFGRIFRHNAVISAAGIPQIAAIMGNCVAGGGYLPVLCDTLLMTEGSGLYLAGPALVKAAIGQEVTDEELGGAEMHAAISGTIDFREPDDEACLVRVRELVSKYAPTGLTEISRRLDRALHTQFKHFDASSQEMRDLFDAVAKKIESTGLSDATREEFATEAVEEYIRRDLRHVPEIIAREVSIREPKRAMAFLRGIVGEPSASAARAVSPITDAANIYDVFTDKPGEQYDARDLIACFVDGRVLDDGEGNESLQPDFDEYKADYGKSIVCGYARLGGR
ncbi:MAG: carboxyl transferase domain-containing protein, partial [Planctomycetota bacterium]